MSHIVKVNVTGTREEVAAALSVLARTEHVGSVYVPRGWDSVHPARLGWEAGEQVNTFAEIEVDTASRVDATEVVRNAARPDVITAGDLDLVLFSGEVADAGPASTRA